METTVQPEMTTNRKTRIRYTLSSLGVSIPVEAVAGIIMFYIEDIKNLPAPWFATFWVVYTIYNALNNPAIGFLSDRTHSRWGRRIPYILFSGIPYVVTFGLLFLIPYEDRRPGQKRKLDGRAEVSLIVDTCSAAPEEHERWTLRLLAGRLVQLGVVATISHETMRRTLKKPVEALATGGVAFQKPALKQL